MKHIIGVAIGAVLVLASIGSMSSSRSLHNHLLNRVMKAPMSFFDTTPLGRILNRLVKMKIISKSQLYYVFKQVIEDIIIDCFAILY